MPDPAPVPQPEPLSGAELDCAARFGTDPSLRHILYEDDVADLMHRLVAELRAARAVLAEQPDVAAWSGELPTQDGFYWYLSPYMDNPQFVSVHNGQRWTFDERGNNLKIFGGIWWGPVQPPKPPVSPRMPGDPLPLP